MDRTVQSLLTKGLAQTYGLTARRLPVQEHAPLRQTHILNIDVVVNILRSYRECGHWKDAICNNMPNRHLQRKNVVIAKDPVGVVGNSAATAVVTHANSNVNHEHDDKHEIL